MALEIERDARVHKLQSAPREPALPLMTCDAACARLVDIARVSCSGVTVLDAHLRYRVSAGRSSAYVSNAGPSGAGHDQVTGTV